MIKTWRCLGRSLLCRLCYPSTIGLAVLTFCSFLPFFSFGAFDYSEDIRVNTVRLYTWIDFDLTPNRLNVPIYNVYSSDEFYSVFSSGRWGFKINLKRSTTSGYNYTLTVPSHTSVFTNNSSSAIGYCVQGYTNSTTGACSFSPLFFPSISSLYQSAATLFSLGYRGAGVQWFQSSGTSSNFCVNVDYPVLVSDVLCSTNTVYRQILLSHLSSISTSVQNIELNVSGLQSSIDEGNNILSNLDSNVSSIDLGLTSFHSNTVAGLSSVSSSLSSLENVSQTISTGIDILNSDFAMNNLDVFLGDDTQTWVDFLHLCESSALLSFEDVLSYVAELQATDQSRSKSYSIPLQHRRFYVKQQIKHACVEAQKLRGKYQSFVSQYDVTNPLSPFRRNFRTYTDALSDGFGMGNVQSELGSIRGNTQQVSDWVYQVKQDLQDWKHSDETGILNTRDFQRRNFEAPIIGSTNTVPFYSFLTNNITVPITSSVDNASVRISSNIVDQAQETRDLFRDTLLNPDYDGVNVRIKYPIWGQDGAAVHVHDEALDAFSAGMADIQQALDALVMASGSPSGLTNYYSVVTNLLGDILLSVLTNRSSYLLLDDYESYVSNGVYFSSIETFSHDFPSIYSNLVNYGLSPSGDGNFWSLFGATLLHHNEFIGSLLADIKEVRLFADSNLADGVLGTAIKAASAVPSVDDISSKLDQLTNTVNSISFDSLTNLVSSLSNTFNSAVSPFNIGSELPSEIVFFTLKKSDSDPGKVFTIPVREHSEVWSLIRLFMGVSLCIVNLILLPKFVLRIVRLYVRLFWGAISIPK